MRSIDPNEVLSMVTLNPDCPANLQYVVRWIKLMVKVHDVSLEKDIEVIVQYFKDSVNSKSWPRMSLLEIKTSDEDIKANVYAARDWIWKREVM